ncbi:hypothetical protein ACJX0J_023147, partial [Zea mays]
MVIITSPKKYHDGQDDGEEDDDAENLEASNSASDGDSEIMTLMTCDIISRQSIFAYYGDLLIHNIVITAEKLLRNIILLGRYFLHNDLYIKYCLFLIIWG